MKTFVTMVKTEFKLSIRGMDIVIFGIAMPVAVAIILGIIYSGKPAFEGADYSFYTQSFGALTSIAICATGLMGLPLVIADYRDKKILKRYKVTPVKPFTLLVAQAVVNMIQSLISLVLIFIVSIAFFGYKMEGSPLVFLGTYLLVLISIYSIGLMVAGIAPNLKTANIIICLLYFPMLIFSGATLPYEIMPTILQKAADILPLTQGIKLLKGVSLGLPIENTLISLFSITSLAVICILISLKFFKWE